MKSAPPKMVSAISAAKPVKSTKPAIKIRHIKLAGRSAFPAGAAAFGPAGGATPPQPAFGQDPGGPAPGDAGA